VARTVSILVALVVVLSPVAGCGSDATDAARVAATSTSLPPTSTERPPSPTPADTATPQPTGTHTATPTPTETAIPSPTETPLPTDTPTGAHTPVPVEPAFSIDVPRGTAPRVDGKLSDGEWDEARVVTMSGGGQLYLMHAAGYLFLGIRGNEDAIGSICQYRDGEVSILHASGGYATFFYGRDAGAWDIRTVIYGSYATQLPESLWQEQHLEDYGWTASVSDDGNPGEIEYQIALQGGEAILAVASVFGFGDAGFLHYEAWPEHLDDDCGRMEVGAEVPDISRLQFYPETWVRIITVGE
jgi:hypothetical protein